MTAGRALAGDVTSMAKLGLGAGRRIMKSRLVRRITLAATICAVALVVSLCGLAGASSDLPVDVAPPTALSGPMWAAYRSAAGLQCDAAGNIARGLDDLGDRWERGDPVLVASIGRFESLHGTAVAVNPAFAGFSPSIDAFGQFAGPILSVPLYDPADFHPDVEDDPLVSTVWDTDGGRWDFNPWIDHAIGPTQTLPSFVAAWGTDGNGDGIVDPHNAWDAVATTAAFFCSGAGEGTSADDMILAYSNDREYLELVTVNYPRMAETWAGLAPLPLPGGAPLVRDPGAQVRWGWTANSPSLADPLMAALLDAVGDADLDGGGLGIEPGDLKCSGDLCVWEEPPVPPAVVEEWLPLRSAGLGAPVLSPRSSAIIVVGLLPETGATIAWPVPSAADRPEQQLSRPLFPPDRDTVSFPLPVAPWPATPLPAPDRLRWHVEVADPRWHDTAGRSGTLRIGTPVAGVEVYAPVAGELTADGDCAAITTADRWRWQLCGLTATSATLIEGGSQNHTGQRIGFTASDVLVVALSDPDGIGACPQALTRRWGAAARSPSGDWSVRSPGQIVSRIVVLWSTADDPAVDQEERDAAEAAAGALVEDLFESCMSPASGPSPFRDRRSN